MTGELPSLALELQFFALVWPVRCISPSAAAAEASAMKQSSHLETVFEDMGITNHTPSLDEL